MSGGGQLRYDLRMAEDPVIDLLAKQSAARLRDMDATVSKKIGDLLVQQAWVRRALEAKGVAVPPREAPSNGNGARAKRKRSNKRNAIMNILVSDPDRVWLPSEVRERLLAEGIDSSVEAVRVTLRRMGEDDELERPPDGNGWKLSDSTTHQHTSTEPEGPDTALPV